LTFFMERQGAEVVSVEAADDYAWELGWDGAPGTGPDPAVQDRLRSHREMMGQLKNSYWLSHHALSSRALVHYGSAYLLPAGLGKFDVSVMACVLLHNKDPFRILENCARITRDAVVVVEPHRELQPAQSRIEFMPRAGDRTWDTWWGFSPGYFTSVLASMGFADSRVSYHTQTCYGRPAPLFTVVARRGERAPDPADDLPGTARLSCAVEQLRIEAGALLRLPVRFFNGSVQVISPDSASPVLLSYHWRRRSGEVVVWDGLRTALPSPVRGGGSEEVWLAVRAPDEAGDYLLEVTAMRENVLWFDVQAPGFPLRIGTTVTSPA
jgi:hypothetical protein